MLDEILEMFDRNKKKRPAGKRSLLGRVTDAISDRDHRPYAERPDRRYADDHRRPDGDRHERRHDDARDDDRPRYAGDRHDDDDDDRPRYGDDRYRGAEHRPRSKKQRFADLLEFD